MAAGLVLTSTPAAEADDSSLSFLVLEVLVHALPVDLPRVGVASSWFCSCCPVVDDGRSDWSARFVVTAALAARPCMSLGPRDVAVSPTVVDDSECVPVLFLSVAVPCNPSPLLQSPTMEEPASIGTFISSFALLFPEQMDESSPSRSCSFLSCRSGCIIACVGSSMATGFDDDAGTTAAAPAIVPSTDGVPRLDRFGEGGAPPPPVLLLLSIVS
mmetsp:Transcript_29861/g.65727  ORF Transcript_29861/g.65727 Transcript_29861/m.65727 type:complete len:215 (+) Transcript_29861:1497-2141(+)